MADQTPEQIEEAIRLSASLQRELQAEIIAGLAGLAGLAQSAQRRWEERWEIDQLAADLFIASKSCLRLTEPEVRYRKLLTELSVLHEQQMARRKAAAHA